MEQRTSQSMLAGVEIGDQSQWDRLCKIYGPEIWKLVRHKFGLQQADAEEIGQEVFLNVHLKFCTYDRTRSFTAWFRAIAYHEAIDLLRKRQKSLLGAVGGTNAHERLLQIEQIDSEISRGSCEDAEGFCNERQVRARAVRQFLVEEVTPEQRMVYELVAKNWTAAEVLEELRSQGIDLGSANNVYQIKGRVEKRVRAALAGLFEPLERPG